MGKLEGQNNLEILGINEMIILNISARNDSSFDWDYLCFFGDLCQDIVKNIVNLWIA